jgi:hypothetical protein
MECVVDRLIQQAICQILSPIFEKQFSDNSFGVRPKSSAYDALKDTRPILQCGRWATQIMNGLLPDYLQLIIQSEDDFSGWKV